MELKKEDRFKMVRCVDPKTNVVKRIPAHAVAECVKTYGLVVQDHIVEKPNEKVEKSEVKTDDKAETIEDLTAFEDQQAETIRDKYFRLFGKKAGNKSDATILKEIEEFENQNK